MTQIVIFAFVVHFNLNVVQNGICFCFVTQNVFYMKNCEICCCNYVVEWASSLGIYTQHCRNINRVFQKSSEYLSYAAFSTEFSYH